MKRLVLIPLSVILVAAFLCVAHIRACDGPKKMKLDGVAVSRCIGRDVTLSFAPPNSDDEDKRVYITISDADARTLYETLKPYHDKEANK